MTHNQRAFVIAFLISFVPQLAIWISYLLFGVDSSGRETTFQSIILWVYSPVVALIQRFRDITGWYSWLGYGVQLFVGPLVGAITYSVLFAFAAQMVRRGRGSGPSAV